MKWSLVLFWYQISTQSLDYCETKKNQPSKCISSTRITALYARSISTRSGVVMELTAGMPLSNFWNIQWKNRAPVYIYTSGAYNTHGFPQIFHGLRRAPHDHTNARPSAHLRLCETSENIYSITRNCSSQLNRILKTKSVQNKDRFRRIRYSEMDIPTNNICSYHAS